MKIFNQEKKWIWESFDTPKFSYKKVDLSSFYYKLGVLKTSMEFISRDTSSSLSLSLLSKEASNIANVEDNGTISATYKKSLEKILLNSKKSKLKVLTKEILFLWHETLFSNSIDKTDTNRSSYRADKEDVEIISYNQDNEEILFIAPSYNDVDKLMTDFLKWVNSDVKIDVVYKAAIANLWFMMIHPFDDGNGRIARLISNFILSKNDLTNSIFYFLSSSINSNIEEYYSVLDEICIQTDLDINLWIKWFIKVLNESLNDSIKNIEVIKTKTVFWNRYKNIDLNERQKIIIHEMLSSLPYVYKGGMKVNKYITIVDTPKITASRDLSDLASKGIMKSHAKGRNVYYTLVV